MIQKWKWVHFWLQFWLMRWLDWIHVWITRHDILACVQDRTCVVLNTLPHWINFSCDVMPLVWCDWSFSILYINQDLLISFKPILSQPVSSTFYQNRAINGWIDTHMMVFLLFSILINDFAIQASIEMPPNLKVLYVKSHS